MLISVQEQGNFYRFESQELILIMYRPFSSCLSHICWSRVPVFSVIFFWGGGGRAAGGFVGGRGHSPLSLGRSSASRSG